MNEQQQERLEELVKVLCDRFGRRTTLGEVFAAVIGIRRLSRGDTLCVSDLAELSGEPVSNVSRWLRQVPHLQMVPDPEDERRKLIQVVDWERAGSHFDALVELLDGPISSQE